MDRCESAACDSGSTLLKVSLLATVMSLVMSTTVPATGDNAPVGASESGVTQSVQDRIDRTVDVAQPISCHT